MQYEIPDSPDELLRQLNPINPLIHLPDDDVWAIYVRKSREDRRHTEYSLEIQPDRAEEYARSKGAKTILTYCDAYKSGRNSNRPMLQQLIRDIKAGKINKLAVHRLDRSYRNLESLLKFVRLIKSYNVRLISVTEQIDTDNWWGRLVLYILGALAEMYIWQTSERTREAKAERARRGLPNGMLPLGFCNGLCSTCTDPNGEGYCPLFGSPDRPESQRGRIPVPHPIDRHVIVLIAVSYHNGMSYKEIAIYINEHDFQLPDGSLVHFRTKGSPGKNEERIFRPDSIRSVLRNPFHAGMIARYPRQPLDMEDDPEHPDRHSPHKRELPARQIIEWIPGQHEALYPIHFWKENQAICKGKQRTSTNAARQKREYLLTGVGRCWECYNYDGRIAHLRGVTYNGIASYICATKHNHYLSRSKHNNPQPALAEAKLTAQESSKNEDALYRMHRTNLKAERPDERLFALLEKLVIPAEWYEPILAYSMHEDGMAVFEWEGRNIRQELARQRQLYQRGHIDLATFEERALVLNRQLQSLQPSAHPEAQKVTPWLKDFSALWKNMTPRQHRVLLDTIFAAVYVDAQGEIRKVTAYSPFDDLLGLNAKPVN
jgi:DNA invertase Pin-like site-specific DNA recombinase